VLELVGTLKSKTPPTGSNHHKDEAQRSKRVGRGAALLLLLLKSRGVTYKTIAEHFDYSVKSARRDIASLEYFGVPIEFTDFSTTAGGRKMLMRIPKEWAGEQTERMRGLSPAQKGWELCAACGGRLVRNHGGTGSAGS